MFPWETLITGAVGLVGIGGTLWQGKRAREAQTADVKAKLDATAENLVRSTTPRTSVRSGACTRNAKLPLMTCITP